MHRQNVRVASTLRRDSLGSSIAMAVVLVSFAVVAASVVRTSFVPLGTRLWSPDANAAKHHALEWKSPRRSPLANSYDRFTLPGSHSAADLASQD